MIYKSQIINSMTKQKLAMDLFIESVMKPDSDLRGQASEQECLAELLQIREDVLEYLYNQRKN